MYLDGAPKGTATYGNARPDVGTYFGPTQFNNGGFGYTLSLSGVTSGSHEIEVKVRSTVNSTETTYSRAVSVS